LKKPPPVSGDCSSGWSTLASAMFSVEGMKREGLLRRIVEVDPRA
jgi:hypothetical protein